MQWGVETNYGYVDTPKFISVTFINVYALFFCKLEWSCINSIHYIVSSFLNNEMWKDNYKL
jgi:hypothetical protein